MFRRKRSSSNPPRPGSTTPNAAAALAASQAFLAKKQSDLNLSNSAAAAALRSHTSTPTPVGQVQTKRMQRKGSVSSSNGAPDRPGLQRRGSGSSMTERSFREPSPLPIRPPDRPASSHGPYPTRSTDTPPPVPALPIRYASPNPTKQSPLPRSTSVNMNTRRVINDNDVVLNRAATPGGRSSSAAKQRQTGGGASDSAAAHLAANVANLNTNRGSVNYSRPMSPPNVSAPARNDPVARAMSPEPQIQPVAGLTRLEADRIAAGLQGIAQKPVKKKKKPSELTAPGSHLSAQHGQDLREAQITQSNREVASTSTTSGQQHASSSEQDQSYAQVPTEELSATPLKKMKKKTVLQGTEAQSMKKDEGFGSAYPSDTDSVASDVSTTTDRSRPATGRKKGLLMKQPSIVREDREAEEKAEGKAPAPKKSALTKPAVPVQQVPEASAPTPKSPAGSSKKPKQAAITPETASRSTHDKTLSPSRALHFSSQPTYGSPDGTKHQPLGRSASPAKSAMKSPSRGSSPSLLKMQGFAGSDVSDVGSGVSDEGSQAGKKKKRSVRVSFDSTPVAVGQAASPVASDSPILMSPQNQGNRKTGLSRSLDADSASDQEKEDFAIKPTPILPSFGSVRGKNEKEPGPKSEHGASADQQIGVALAQQQGSLQAGQLPITAISNTDTSTDQQRSLTDNTENKGSKATTEDHVPAIAVLPATPALDDMRGQDNEWLGMPGGFPGAPKRTTGADGVASSDGASASRDVNDDGEDSNADDLERPQSSGRSTPVATPATLGIAEPETEPVAAQHDPSTPHVGEVAESQKGDKGTEDDSVYSDAAEDQTDTEGDGFGSINAIVESPASRPQDAPTPPKSPLNLADGPTAESLQKVDSRESERQRALGYLASLSPAQRAQLDQAALPGAIEEPIVANRTLRGKNSMVGRPKKKTAKPDAQQERNIVLLPKTDYQKSQDLAPQANQKRPMSQPPLSTNQPSGQSLRSGPEPKGLLQKKGRPISAVAMVDYNKPQTSKSEKSARPASTNIAPGKAMAAVAAEQQAKKGSKPKLGRINSNDSDSDSSFKRARSAAPHSGKYQMKRSMRAGGPAAGQSPSANRSSMSSRATDRSSSMGANGRPGGMRMSMRESSGPSQPKRQSLRSPPDASKTERTKSPSRLSFTLGSRSAKKEKPKATPKAESTYSSRFGDSSDEEGGLPTLRSSRFDDSSDEEPSSLAPVRGIPRRIDEGDSTDLEDSSVENVKAPNSGKSNDTQPTSVSAPSTKPGGSALALGSMRSKPKGSQQGLGIKTTISTDQATEKEKKKRSFFSISRRRKDEPSRVRNSVLGPSSPFNTPSKSVEEKVNTPASPVAANPQAAALRPSALSNVQSSPKVPKLQKRATSRSPARGGEGWPLKPAGQTKDGSPNRPQTSDGNVSPTGPRPDLGNRRITLQTTPDAAAIAQAGATPAVEKKKRFGMLRKAFGMKK